MTTQDKIQHVLLQSGCNFTDDQLSFLKTELEVLVRTPWYDLHPISDSDLESMGWRNPEQVKSDLPLFEVNQGNDTYILNRYKGSNFTMIRRLNKDATFAGFEPIFAGGINAPEDLAEFLKSKGLPYSKA